MSASERIVITRPLPGDPVRRFTDAGFDEAWIHPHDRRMTRGELLEAVRGVHAVVSTPADTLIDHEFFDVAGDQLVIVSNYAVGVDNIDLAEAKRRGVLVGHTPDAVTEPTADAVWMLLLAVAKRAHEGNALIREDRWVGVGPNQLLGQRVLGKTLLIVGAGRIGHAVARRAIGWNLEVLYHARSRHEEFEAPPISARRVTLEKGLAAADFVSLHTPLTEETRHMIDDKRLGLMKPTAILINTSRGGVIDEAALVSALREHRIAGAGLDVFEHEPHLAEGLRELDNVFLQPHSATATREDREWMMRLAVDNAIAALKGEPVPHAYPLFDSPK